MFPEGHPEPPLRTHWETKLILGKAWQEIQDGPSPNGRSMLQFYLRIAWDQAGRTMKNESRPFPSHSARFSPPPTTLLPFRHVSHARRRWKNSPTAGGHNDCKAWPCSMTRPSFRFRIDGFLQFLPAEMARVNIFDPVQSLECILPVI